MKRAFFVALAIAATASMAFAQADVITERKAIMKGNADATRTGAQLAKGEVPFDQQKAAEVFKGIAEGMDRFPTLFPEGTHTGDTRAAPAIWQDPQGFAASSEKIFKEASQAAQTVTDLASFQAAFQSVTANCASCHQTYRTDPPR